MRLFKQYKKYTKSNGIVVTKFKPQTEIYIDSINLESGRTEEKLVTEFSKHENLVMFKISDAEKRFKDFWVSEDHSLVLFDKESGTLRKESPKRVRKGRDFLVQKKDEKVSYINIEEIDISADPTKTVAYDFTVKDNYTFCTDDGIFIQDTMALYAPITKEAVAEAKDKLISSKSASGMNNLSDDFSKDIIIGIFSLTRVPTGKEKPVQILKDESLIDQMDIYDVVKFENIETTVGRILFNRRVLPDKYKFLNEPIDKKKLNSIALDIYKNFDKPIYIEFCHNVVKYGMKYFTVVAPSFTLDDLEIPPSILKLKEKLRGTTPEEADKIIKKMEELLEQHLIKSGSSLGLIGQAGGLKGGYSQVRQILVAKGLIQDSQGNPLPPISDSFSDGLNSQEFFNSGIGSRSGIVNRVINTADTGYLSRQLVFALQRVEADPEIKDCGTTRRLRLKVTPDLSKKLNGRFVFENNKIVPFSPGEHGGKVIELRSPLYCLSDKICYACYGDLAYRNRTPYVGVLAGHLLGEPLTQTIMRQFHTGGSVTMKSVDIIKEITKVISEKEKNAAEEIIIQKNSNLYSKLPGTIIINSENYLEPKKDILIQESGINLKYGYFELKFEGVTLQVTLDVNVFIPMGGKELSTEGKITKINFAENNLVFTIPPTSEAFTKQIRIITSLLSGRQPWRSADHFALKVYDFYKDLRDLDLIHIEILASNLLRDKGNPSHPARLNKSYQPTVVPLKSLPAIESWLQSLEFEVVNKSITQGLVYDRPEEETILERIVTGNI